MNKFLACLFICMGCFGSIKKWGKILGAGTLAALSSFGNDFKRDRNKDFLKNVLDEVKKNYSEKFVVPKLRNPADEALISMVKPGQYWSKKKLHFFYPTFLKLHIERVSRGKTDIGDSWFYYLNNFSRTLNDALLRRGNTELFQQIEKDFYFRQIITKHEAGGHAAVFNVAPDFVANNEKAVAQYVCNGFPFTLLKNQENIRELISRILKGCIVPSKNFFHKLIKKDFDFESRVIVLLAGPVNQQLYTHDTNQVLSAGSGDESAIKVVYSSQPFWKRIYPLDAKYYAKKTIEALEKNKNKGKELERRLEEKGGVLYAKDIQDLY